MKSFKSALENNQNYIVTQYAANELKFILEREKIHLDNIPSFSNDSNKWEQKNNYFVVWKGFQIVGLAKTQIDLSDLENKILELCYIEVAPENQNQGVASILTKTIFNFCKQYKYSFKTCIYSTIGEMKLKPLFNSLAEKKEVNFIDYENCKFVEKNFFEQF